MTNNPQEKSRLTPEHVKVLAKFFGLLWETQKELLLSSLFLLSLNALVIMMDRSGLAFSAFSHHQGTAFSAKQLSCQHVPLLLGGEGTCPGGEHIRYDIERIIDKQARNLLLIRLDLVIGIIFAHTLVRWRFQLHHHKRKSVDHHH